MRNNFRWELGLVAPLLPAAPYSPPSESLRLPSPTSQPKRLETKNVVSTIRNRWRTMRLWKPGWLTHQSKWNRADHKSIYPRLNPPIYLGTIQQGCVASRSAWSQAGHCMAKSETSRILRVGSNNHSPLAVPRLTFPPSPRGLLLGFHAHQLFAARRKWTARMNGQVWNRHCSRPLRCRSAVARIGDGVLLVCGVW